MNIEEAIGHCFNKNFPFAVWQNPGGGIQKIILEKKDDFHFSIEELIFRPFQENETNCSLSIRNDLEFIPGNDNSKFIDYLLKNEGNSRIARSIPKEKTKTEYLKLVEKAKEHIASDSFQKVVLSRNIHKAMPSNFKLSNMFSALCSKYTQAFVYLINHPKGGTWMGASPELLLSKKDELYQTVSLAATKVFSKKNESLVWSDKELDEQEIVTQSIKANLKGLRIDSIQQEGPMDKVAANLVHLQTKFSYSYNGKYTDLTKVLHPTPAVCGHPKEAAAVFISKEEGYNRSYYSGYLGPVTEDSINLFVNLRCMQIFPRKLVLYVGGGITANSISEDEWKETENKADTLLSVIRNL